MGEAAAKLARVSKVLVIGPGGAGKSTLARRLGEVLDLEVIHLDQFYWGAGWIEPAKEEWEKTVQRLVERDSWVMDGNYGGTMDPRFAAADAVIFLDFPRNVSIRRVLSCGLRYAGKSRPDMAPGCPERVTFGFLKYLWRYPTERPRYPTQARRSLPG